MKTNKMHNIKKKMYNGILIKTILVESDVKLIKSVDANNVDVNNLQNIHHLVTLALVVCLLSLLSPTKKKLGGVIEAGLRVHSFVRLDIAQTI